MKRGFSFIALLFVLHITYGQVETKYFKNKDSRSQVSFINAHPNANKIIELPYFDVQKEIDEDKTNDRLDKPYRFGKGFDFNISLVMVKTGIELKIILVKKI